MSNEPAAQPAVEVIENGPYRVTGLPLVRLRRVLSDEGGPIDWERVAELESDDTFDLCRCGESHNKPYCDGTEEKIGFDGTETADRRPTADRWREFGEGPAVLTDDTRLCARAGFCMARVPDAWDLADLTEDPERREQMAALVRRCPSGRLGYLLPPAQEPIEEELPQEVGVVVDGPYWVRGGVQVVAADGFRYEVRNRITLCRCGHSRNKPFCDGSHIGIGFTDDA